MKAVILAAGASSRMWPLAADRHKAFEEICGKPLVEYAIQGLAQNGFSEIILIAGGRDEKRAHEVAARNQEKMKTEICVSNEHGGMGSELLQISDRLEGGAIIASGHSVGAGEAAGKIAALGDCDAAFCATACDDVSEYGRVAIGGRDGTVEKIEEKPEGGGPGLRIVGTYRIGEEFMSALEKVPQGHYSFEAALDSLVAKGRVKAALVEGYQPTLKYPWHLLALKNSIMDGATTKERQVAESASVSKSAIIGGAVAVGENSEVMENAVIKGPAVIGKNAKVMENAVIKGPAYIGDGVVVGTGTLVRDYSDLEDGAVAGFGCEIKNSLFFAGAHLHGSFAGDSIIGRNCRLGAGCVLANRRLDRASVKSAGKGGRMVDTGLGFFGAVLGAGASMGVNASAMPGVKIGAGAAVLPNCVAKKDVKDGEAVGD